LRLVSKCINNMINTRTQGIKVSLFIAMIFTMIITSCDNDNNESLQEENIYTTYSNKLAVGSNANLTLRYSGEPMIGRDLTVNIPDGKKANIDLRYILPGDEHTALNNVALTRNDTSYVFSGNGQASNTATTFNYNGYISDSGKMLLDITNAAVPQGMIKGNTTFGTVAYGGMNGTVTDDGITYNNSIYYKLKIKNPDATNLMAVAYTMALNTMLNNLITLTLKDVTFHTDGNITAHYADLPDTLKGDNLINYNGFKRPDDAQFKPSPMNLAMYYFENDTAMRAIPNIDYIIATVKANSTRAAIVDSATLKKMTEVTAALTKWSTTGLPLTFKKNPNAEYKTDENGDISRYKGDYVVYADKKDLQSLTAIIDIIIALTPQETLKADLFETLEKQGVVLPDNVKEMIPNIKEMLEDTTIGGILNTMKNNFADFSEFQIGLYLVGN
jgi:hypothetical protein